MATYKVIQDIEAEDKLVGPLTLRQFIYAAIAAVCAYISFLGVSKGAYFILVIFGPIMLIAGFFCVSMERRPADRNLGIGPLAFRREAAAAHMGSNRHQRLCNNYRAQESRSELHQWAGSD